MLHKILIYIHAAGGIIAFLAGCIVLNPAVIRKKIPFRIYFLALCVMILFLLAAVINDWGLLPVILRIVYTGLSLLAIYMGFRSYMAGKTISRNAKENRGDFIDHIGFTLISLFDGFVIVGAIDLNMAGWVVAIIGAGGILLGRGLISNFKKRVSTHS